MKLNKNILSGINDIFDTYYKLRSSDYTGERLCEELIYHFFYTDEDMDYVENGDFANDYFKIAIETKSEQMVYQAFDILRNCGKMYRKDIINSVNSLLLETWHSSQEEAMYMIIMYLQDTSSIPYLKKATIWDDKCIEFFKDGFHKDAIRRIFQIAKKDSIEILESLVGKVDEETAPFLKRKIKEAKEIYLNCG